MKETKQQEKAKSRSRNVLPFWLQIVLILIGGGILSIAVFMIVRQNNEVTLDASEPTYAVTFAYQDGTIIDKRQVKEGTGVSPPELETEGVFRGWSGIINSVTHNIEVHPVIYKLSEDENLFCFDSVYAHEGETFSIDVRLEGNVNISNAEIEIKYDNEVIDFLHGSAAEFCTITQEETGVLLLTVTSKLPITEATSLVKITFFAREKDAFSTQINLRCIRGTLSADGEEFPATVSTINNEIYFLQEVSQ